MTIEYPITSLRGQAMLSYLPPMYETSRVMRAILQGEGAEFDKVSQALNEALNQFFVRTATWGLDSWENELGLPPDPSLTDAQRQDRIVSRLRGFGTATITVVKSVAQAFDKGAIDVAEDYPGYKVIIYFVDTTGIPSNLADMQAAVRAVVPAHLDVVYEFNYFLWSELDALNYTWDQVDVQNKTWDQWEVFK